MTTTLQATPRKGSVRMTAACEHCGGELHRTYDYDGEYQYPWYHDATGNEDCQPEALAAQQVADWQYGGPMAEPGTTHLPDPVAEDQPKCWCGAPADYVVPAEPDLFPTTTHLLDGSPGYFVCWPHNHSDLSQPLGHTNVKG